MSHGRNTHATESDMAMATMCAYTPSHHEFLHWKFVLHSCPSCPSIDLTGQDSDSFHSTTSPTIRFHVYHLIAHCTVHERHPERNLKLLIYLQDLASVTPAKIYTRKELALMETSVYEFHTSFYIIDIQKLAFHLPHVRILGTHCCGNTLRKSFKLRRTFQYFLCHCDYSKRVVSNLHIKYN